MCTFGSINSKTNLMKIKFGAFVVDGRGKIGGTVFAKNKGGAYARNKVTPSNPNTSFQQTVRSIFGSVSAAWRGLTNSQREAWNAAVLDWTTTNVFADVLVPSGKALFQRLNTSLANAGIAILEDVPVPQAFPFQQLNSVSAVAASDTILASFSSAGAEGQSYTFYGSPRQSGATTNVSNQMRRIGTFGGANLPTGADLYAAYVARFGDLVAGDVFNIACDLLLDATGQVQRIGDIRVTTT